MKCPECWENETKLVELEEANLAYYLFKCPTCKKAYSLSRVEEEDG
jgi:hypothetical protein